MKKKYNAKTKAAVMAALLEGQGAAKIAAAFKIPEGTVKAWGNRLRRGSTESRVATEKREEIGGLLIEYLHANLSTLKAQQLVFADPKWLKLQDAGELAVLHGVMTDKAIRLLEALGGTAPAAA